MSGVEAAGIALAVFPLCIELVKLYRNGAETLDYMRRRHHQKALRNFHRELGIEYSKFLNSLYEIFGDEITEEACIRVFRNPAGNEAQERLEARLDYSPHVAKSFTEAIEYLREELEDLKSIFPWDQGIGDMTVVEHIQCVQAGSQIPQTLRQAGKNLKKRFQFAVLKEELSRRMQKIRDINDDIHKLAQGARQSATNRKTASKKELCVVQNYCKRVRDSAQSICNSLRSVILHDCGDHEHGISLCLEMRDAAGRVLPNLKACSSTLRFRIVFSLAESKSGPKNSSTHPVSGWKELEVEPIVSEGDMDIDENKPLLDVICGDGSIPAIHLNNLDINSQGELSRTMRPIEAASRNTDLMQPTSNINTCTLRQERPTTPTKQVRFGFSQKVVKLLGFDNSSTPSQVSDTMSVSTSQPPSREPTPEPLGRSMKEKAVQSMSNVEAEMIYDLCLKLKKSTVATRDYLGLLKGDAEKSTNVAHLHQYHRVWSMPPGDCFNPANQVVMKYPISLCTLFGTDVHSRNISVSIEHRLSLGIKLASSVIQFHKTLWLNGLWCNQDIVFFVNPQTNDPFMETPMVLQKLPLSYSSDSSASRLMCQAVPAVRDINSNILLSLGILLCELWCWKRLKDFDSCRDILKSLQVPDNYNQWTSFALAGAAHEAHKSLGFDAPLPYREAVAACLSKNVPTEDKEFVSTVWEKVVRPLKESLSFFTGEKFVL